MKNIDDALRNVVSEEDAEFLARLEREPGPFQQMAGIFQGPLNSIYIAYFVVAVLVGIGGVYSGWRFATATDLRPLFYWGGATGFCLVVLAVVRLVLFMQLNTNRMLRELKRLELQIALLAARSNS
jgi:hypothetical protein